MTDNQEKEFERLGLNFQSLWGRPLQAIDCQNLFCETDKYCRAAFPNLKSNRKKIKSKFTTTLNPIHYFYPPKWKINDKVEQTLSKRLPQLEVVNLERLNNNNYKQLTLELDSLNKLSPQILETALKTCKIAEPESKLRQEIIKEKPKKVNLDIKKSQQLCLF